MRRLIVVLCAMFAFSSFLSGAAHARAHADVQHHFMVADHHADDHGHSHEAPDQENDQKQGLDHKDHPAELHFVALDIVPPECVSRFESPFVRLSTAPQAYRGPIPLREPDPERLPA